MSYQSKKSTGERSIGLIFVVLFHVLLVWGLASGLAHDLTTKVADVIQTKVVEDQQIKEEVEPPPPPPPDTKIPPPDFVPPPSFDFVPDVGPTTAIQQVTKTAPAPKAEPATMTKPKAKASNSKPDYPQASVRAGEEGVVGINIYVTEDGRVGEVKLEKSSGFERLDEAVLKHVKRAWKFTPCMQGDKPIACWYPLNLRMQIKQE